MPIDPVIGAALIGAASEGVGAISRGGPKRQYKYNKKLAEDQNRMNRENQQWILEQNKELQREQRAYDSPEAQMARLKAAGLNPNLVYGNGGSVGQVFPIDAGNLPPANMGQVDATIPIPDPFGGYIRASQAMSQTGLNQQRSAESAARTGLLAMQEDIARTNPMLSPEVAQAVSDEMMNTAQLKSAQSWYQKNSWVDVGKDQSSRVYKAKIDAELQSMIQKLGLNTADLAIRNKILESKEFENAVKEINVKWLKDAEVSPEHIRQGLMLLLSKMLGN